MKMIQTGSCATKCSEIKKELENLGVKFSKQKSGIGKTIWVASHEGYTIAWKYTLSEVIWAAYAEFGG